MISAMQNFYCTLGLQYPEISLKLKRKVGRYLSFYRSFPKEGLSFQSLRDDT